VPRFEKFRVAWPPTETDVPDFERFKGIPGIRSTAGRVALMTEFNLRFDRLRLQARIAGVLHEAVLQLSQVGGQPVLDCPDDPVKLSPNSSTCTGPPPGSANSEFASAGTRSARSPFLWPSQVPIACGPGPAARRELVRGHHREYRLLPRGESGWGWYDGR